MDPSNNNSFGSPQVPGSSGGAGLSGADFGAQNGGNVAQSAGSTVQNAGAIVSGAGTTVDNTGTGGAGGFKSSNFPSGGITIGSEKRSRKGLIIAGFAFFALAIGGGIAALVLMNNGGSGSGESSNGGSNSTIVVDENVSMEVAFNRYANYLVSGEVKDEAVENAAFEGDIMLRTRLNDEDYLKGLGALFDVFRRKTYNEDSIFVKNGVDVGTISEGLDFLENYRNVNGVDTEQLLIKYNTSVQSSDDYINTLNTISDDENDLTRAFKEHIAESARATIAYWNILKSNGCIIDQTIDYNCVNEVDVSVLSPATMKLGKINSDIDLFPYDVVEGIRDQSRDVNAFILENIDVQK